MFSLFIHFFLHNKTAAGILTSVSFIQIFRIYGDWRYYIVKLRDGPMMVGFFLYLVKRDNNIGPVKLVRLIIIDYIFGIMVFTGDFAIIAFSFIIR